VAFTCPFCGAVSHNPNDALNRYCGRCHRFVDDGPPPAPSAEIERIIPAEHLLKVCRPVTGPTCCAYLASRDLSNYFCAKGSPDLRRVIDDRLARGAMNATGDNCSGPPDYVPSR
jgi:hypothetical protein